MAVMGLGRVKSPAQPQQANPIVQGRLFSSSRAESGFNLNYIIFCIYRQSPVKTPDIKTSK